jgi:hypothetical protein
MKFVTFVPPPKQIQRLERFEFANREAAFVGNRLAHSRKVKLNKFGGPYVRGAKYAPELRQCVLDVILQQIGRGFPRGWQQEICRKFHVSPSYVSKLLGNVRSLDLMDRQETVELLYGDRQGWYS